MDDLFPELKSIEFYIKINDEFILVPSSIIVFLASNKDGVLSHFLSGYFHKYPDFGVFNDRDWGIK